MTEVEKYDEAGNKVCLAVGLDSDGYVIAQKMGCDKDNCNCTGSWTEGDEEQVEKWLYRGE
jgi:hypothetical protein